MEMLERIARWLLSSHAAEDEYFIVKQTSLMESLKCGQTFARGR